MPIDFILPVSMTFALVTWGLIFYWYIHPLLKKYPVKKALEPILLLHTFRYIGLMFLIPGVTSEVLDSRFANPAAYGDLVAAILAFVSIAAIRLNLSLALPSVWVFNFFGLVDLLNAVARGIMYTPGGYLGATFWIPATLVPLLLVTHAYIFILLYINMRKNRKIVSIPNT